MPFKFHRTLSKQCGVHELGDYMEWQAWLNGQVSLREVLAQIGRVDDNFDNEGCEDDSDEAANFLDEVMVELETRSRSCNGGYPFQLNDSGTILLRSFGESSARHLLYGFLLLATRLNMKTDREFEGIRGDLLFEEISAQVLQNYLGFQLSAALSDRPRRIAFGTSSSLGFEERVNHLCREIGEGGGYNNWDTGRTTEQDGALDAVSWIPFSDGRESKLSIFAQCKTGASDYWKKFIGELKPSAFLKAFTLHRSFQLQPVPAFCVAEASDPGRWARVTSNAELFFDRCRIVDFGEKLDEDTVLKMRSWTEAALSRSREHN